MGDLGYVLKHIFSAKYVHPRVLKDKFLTKDFRARVLTKTCQKFGERDD
jgi:hypothetical protein